ncbi:segregation and condensation protein B [Maritalea mobilis]|uniref:Segregation and condensation protein B n=1 Tax=Maritalea mobilis TaxID=483324 RepID=A0A4R6VZZ5_9HYPH|nr:SMC-Scp complex subunit ScpB [Maritalea mobilis]TDQ66225.1 segregation and condensation protein B [Maritalea mobilis]
MEPEIPESDIQTRNLRVLEALLFAAKEPLGAEDMHPFLSDNADLADLLDQLQQRYQHAGVNLVKRGEKYAFRTAEDLSFLLRRDDVEQKPLSRAALETLSIIAYHQPVTRSEIEEVRGVATSKGTLDVLMEAGWVRMRGRRRTPGRPVTYGTTLEFLDHFGLEQISDLPGLGELKGAGLLSSTLPPDFSVPKPVDGDLTPDEDPLEPDDTGDDLLSELEAANKPSDV